MQKVALLVHGGYLGLQNEKSSITAIKLNQVVANSVVDGAPYRYLCCPKIINSIPITDLDLILISLSKEVNKTAALDNLLFLKMLSINRLFVENGKEIKNETQAMEKATQIASAFIKERYPNYKRLLAI